MTEYWDWADVAALGMMVRESKLSVGTMWRWIEGTYAGRHAAIAFGLREGWKAGYNEGYRAGYEAGKAPF